MLKSGNYFFSGNEACSEGAIAADCKIFAGYPITPSTEIAEHLAQRLPESGGTFIQMEDELASIGAVLGGSWGGNKSMTATSGPGLSLMQEHISFAVTTETPCVIVDVQRGSPGTGVVASPMQGDVSPSRWGHHGACELIALAPATVQEMFDLTIECFNMSEAYRSPAILLADAFIGHLREKMRIPPANEIELIERRRPNIKSNRRWFLDPDGVAPMPEFGKGHHFLVTSTSHNEYGFAHSISPESHQKLIERLNNKILRDIDKITQIETKYLEDAEVAVVSYGLPTRSALSAVKSAREEGIKAGYLRLVSVWPFHDKMIYKMLNGVSKIIVVEMNFGQIVREVQRLRTPSDVHLVSVVCEVPSPKKILRKIREL